MASVAQMKEDLLRYYPFGPWAEKVNKMSEKQIFAVWQRLVGSKQK